MTDSQKYTLVINDKAELRANGIEKVLGFDDDYVLLDSKQGRITVEGSSMAIENLNKESGEIQIVGKISAVIFSDSKTERKSFLRPFK